MELLTQHGAAPPPPPKPALAAVVAADEPPAAASAAEAAEDTAADVVAAMPPPTPQEASPLADLGASALARLHTLGETHARHLCGTFVEPSWNLRGTFKATVPSSTLALTATLGW